jgi:putative colanic acid biosynthesis acetyltransferase WcaF
VQATLFSLSPQFMYGWRNFLLRLFGCRLGEDVIIRQSVRITYPWKVTIGSRAQIGDHVELYSLGPITIGHDAVISQRSYICTGSHDHRSPAFDIYAQPIVIQDQVWLAADCFVYPGVTVGQGAVVAARSTVIDDVEPYSIYAGSPATRRGPRTMREV